MVNTFCPLTVVVVPDFTSPVGVVTLANSAVESNRSPKAANAPWALTDWRSHLPATSDACADDAPKAVSALWSPLT